MTEDAARYIAQVRAQQQLARAQLTRVTQETSQRTHAEAVQQFQASVAGAVTDWEKGVRRSDPDYARKEPVVQKLLHAVVHERGPPRSPAEAVEIAQQAYERANAMVSRFVPNPRPRIRFRAASIGSTARGRSRRTSRRRFTSHWSDRVDEPRARSA